MKRGATLVNTSRGAIVDEVALCDVLRERPDLTVVLDVTHPEPLETRKPSEWWASMEEVFHCD